jgi:hypothetical protein
MSDHVLIVGAKSGHNTKTAVIGAALPSAGEGSP